MPGGGHLPPACWPAARPGSGGAGGAAMPPRQARMSGTPAQRPSRRWAHSCLTGCRRRARRPHPSPRTVAASSVLRGGGDAPSARAASLASSAALPVRAQAHRGRGCWTPTSTPTSTSTRARCVPLPGWTAASPLAVPPRGASRPQKPRPTSPPRGSGAAAPSGALRAIDPSARPRSWRTCGPRRLRRQSEPDLVATHRGTHARRAATRAVAPGHARKLDHAKNGGKAVQGHGPLSPRWSSLPPPVHHGRLSLPVSHETNG